MAWSIEFDPAAARELKKLDHSVARRILKSLFERIATADDPRRLGETIKGSKLACRMREAIASTT